MNPQSNKLVPILIVILIAGAFYVGNLSAKVSYLEKGIGSGNNNGGQVAGAVNPPAAQPTVSPEVSDEVFGKMVEGGHVIGNPKAKVAIVEFSDFQCPFCKRFVDDALVQLKKEYIDTGKAKLVFRHLPLTAIHPFAMGAALASECAGEQGKFEAYHDKLFTNQNALSVEDLKKYAGELGLNSGQFGQCLDGKKYQAKVDADMQLATENGVGGTPGFYVDGKLVSGAQPFSAFKPIIDAAL
jgi:protein-disulfide isomerase